MYIKIKDLYVKSIMSELILDNLKNDFIVHNNYIELTQNLNDKELSKCLLKIYDVISNELTMQLGNNLKYKEFFMVLKIYENLSKYCYKNKDYFRTNTNLYKVLDLISNLQKKIEKENKTNNVKLIKQI